MWCCAMHKARWSEINRLGKTRFSKWSYIWIILIPFLVKILKRFQEECVNIFGYVFDIDNDLPFSWYLFFFGALLFAIASTLYYIFCPELIKQYKNYSEFYESGSTNAKLYRYSKRYGVAHKT